MKEYIRKLLGLHVIDSNIQDIKKKSDEAVFFSNIAKNSSSVFMGGTEVLTRIYTGQKIFVDTRDVSESPHLIMEGVWEEEISKVFQRLINEGDTVFDIGSTYGYFGVVAGTKLRKNKGARLFLIDANPVYAPYMTKNLTINGQIEYSTVSTVALAGKAGQLELNILKDDWASSTFQKIEDFDKHRTAPYEVEKTVSIRALTLDEYAKEHKIGPVDMIKLDIEGLEEDSYPGMKNVIKNSPNLKMLFEFTTEGYKKPKALFDQILKDFTYVYCMPEGGAAVRVSNYDEMLKVADGSWIMLLMSKTDVENELR